ncbi:MAG: hypothetical protein ACLP9C_04065 [Acidimicrobiales bacterium]
MRRTLLVLVLVTVGIVAAACSGSSGAGTATPTTVITRDISACSAIDNQVLGRYRKLSVTEQNIAGQDMLNRALRATDPTIVRIAKQLQTAANAHDLSAMDTYLGNLAERCDQLGIGPQQVAPAASKDGGS